MSFLLGPPTNFLYGYDRQKKGTPEDLTENQVAPGRPFSGRRLQPVINRCPSPWILDVAAAARSLYYWVHVALVAAKSFLGETTVASHAILRASKGMSPFLPIPTVAFGLHLSVAIRAKRNCTEQTFERRRGTTTPKRTSYDIISELCWLLTPKRRGRLWKGEGCYSESPTPSQEAGSDGQYLDAFTWSVSWHRRDEASLARKRFGPRRDGFGPKFATSLRRATWLTPLMLDGTAGRRRTLAGRGSCPSTRAKLDETWSCHRCPPETNLPMP